MAGVVPCNVCLLDDWPDVISFFLVAPVTHKTFSFIISSQLEPSPRKMKMKINLKEKETELKLLTGVSWYVFEC